jgi:charged multivesicular body protein 2A
MSIFGDKKTFKQIVREQKRSVEKSIRELDRERAALEKQEQKLIADIKRMAKKEQLVLVY